MKTLVFKKEAEDTGSILYEEAENTNDGMPELTPDTTAPVKSCQTTSIKPDSWAIILGLVLGMLIAVRRKQ